MSTPITFKRAICRSAAEVKYKEDKTILVLLALNYSREIEKEVSLGDPSVEEYYDFLKDSLCSPTDGSDVIKAVDLEFPVEDVISALQVSPVSLPKVEVEKSLIEEIKENPAPTSTSITESPKESTTGKFLELKGYDWNTAFSDPITRVSSRDVEVKKDVPQDMETKDVHQDIETKKVSDASKDAETKKVSVETRKVSVETRKVSVETRKVSPIPDSILYGDFEAYGIPNVEKVKLISRIGDISNSGSHDQVYDIGLVPRSFKLGNREAVQHVNNDEDTEPVDTSVKSDVPKQEEVSVEAVEAEVNVADEVEIDR